MDILLAIIAVALGAAAFALYSRLRDARAKAADAALRLDHALAAQTEAESRLESVQGRLDDAELMLARAREESAAANAAAEGLRNRIEERDTLLQKQTARADELSSSLLAAKEENATLATRLDMLSRREAELRSEAEERFKNLANEILASNSRTFKQQNEERLGEILSPLRQDLEAFRKKVDEAYNEEARELFSLKDRLKELREIGELMGREAKGLSNALRGNTGIQGHWGEMVLESILEKSGLRRGIEYDTQVTRDADGNPIIGADGNQLRPDVVVRYPDGRCVVIDSKASMTAYLEYCDTDNEARRTAAGREHVNSVRRHFEKLAAKRYDEFIGDSSLDFVMMFIPTDAAYIAAMRLDPGLWQQAYDRRVLIVSPSHLVSALKIIEHIWIRERQTANVVNIAKEAGNMYDKFAAFVESMTKIDKALETTRRNFDDAMKKLSTGTGNLLTRAEKLRKLGVKTSKSLPRNLVEETEDSDPDTDTDTTSLTPIE